MQELQTQAEGVKSREDFVNFVEALLEDLQQSPNDWGHVTLEGFLGVLADSARVLDRIYANESKLLPSHVDWSVFAEVLMAARVRE
jgi:hypothetical protein